MSLTAFVKQPRISEAFDQFATTTRTPKAYKGRSILVPDSHGPNGLAGASFDYLVRFHIARTLRGGEVTVHQRQWLSEYVCERIYPSEVDGGPYDFGNNELWRALLDEAHNAAREYIAGSGCVRCLANLVQYMAHSDLNVRTLAAFNAYFDASGKVASELTALLDQFDPEALFAPKKTVILNPEFVLNEKIGGADGDLIVDDRLIEFKTSKRLSLHKSHLIQLAGYAVLYDLGGVKIDGGIYSSPISSVGVYFARYNALVELSLAELFPGDGYQQFRAVFEDELRIRQKQEAALLERVKNSTGRATALL